MGNQVSTCVSGHIIKVRGHLGSINLPCCGLMVSTFKTQGYA